MKEIRVHSFGGCEHNQNLNDVHCEMKEKMDLEKKYAEKICAMSKYKFHLAFENSIDYSYVTEKFYQGDWMNDSFPPQHHISRLSFSTILLMVTYNVLHRVT